MRISEAIKFRVRREATDVERHARILGLPDAQIQARKAHAACTMLQLLDDKYGRDVDASSVAVSLIDSLDVDPDEAEIVARRTNAGEIDDRVVEWWVIRAREGLKLTTPLSILLRTRTEGPATLEVHLRDEARIELHRYYDERYHSQPHRWALPRMVYKP